MNKNSNLFLNTISLDLSINIKEIVLAILQVIWHTTHYLPHQGMHYITNTTRLAISQQPVFIRRGTICQI